MPLRAIYFDFDGVLCKDKFYESTLVPLHTNVYQWIQSHIFGNKSLVQDWMRGKISYKKINQLVASETNLTAEQLDDLLLESVKRMSLCQDILNLAKKLKSKGFKIGITTDNMDVFSIITVTEKQLGGLFDVVINSADCGSLKKDENGKLYHIALNKLNITPEQALTIDDSISDCKVFESLGGKSFHYSNFSELERWMATNVF